MKTVTAKEPRSKTAEVLEKMRKGNEVLITLTRKPTAILRPLKNKERDSNALALDYGRIEMT